MRPETTGAWGSLETREGFTADGTVTQELKDERDFCRWRKSDSGGNFLQRKQHANSNELLMIIYPG